MSHRPLLRATVVAISLLGLQACAHGVRVGAIPVASHVTEALAEDQTPPAPGQGGSVRVVVERAPGGLALRNGRDTDDGWVSVEMPPTPAGVVGTDAVATYHRAWLNSLRETHGTSAVIFLQDYTPALAEALRHHLGRRFAMADVRVAEPSNDRSGASFVVASHLSMRDDGIKRAEIVLQNADGGQATGDGERRPRRHLGWMIPLVIATGTAGLILLNWITPHIHRSAVQRAVADAIDRAARDYADRITQACRAPTAPAYCSAPTPTLAHR